MKYLKIILAILAVASIGVAIYFGYTKPTDVPDVNLQENQFLAKINQEINKIANNPKSQFCKAEYDKVKYHIDAYAKENRLGKDSMDSLGNSQNQQSLLKTLYSTYAEKFIAQADYVFNGSAWPTSDLNFIKAEANRLCNEGWNNKWLQVNGPVDKAFSRLISTVDSYYSEVAYINKCKSFSFSPAALALDSIFPISEAQAIISDAKSHLDSLQGVVKNSEVVTKGLSSIPEKVLSVHVDYLTKKLNDWKGMYTYCHTFKAYETELYNKLKANISQLGNPMYSGLIVSPQKTKLLNDLEAEHTAARIHFL